MPDFYAAREVVLYVPDHFEVITFNLSKSIFFFGATAPHPQWGRASLFTRFLDHTQRLTTVGSTSLDE
jgi:hypothetical protein